MGLFDGLFNFSPASAMSMLSTIFLWIFLILIFAAIVGGMLGFFYYLRIYNMRAVIFGKVQGRVVKLYTSPMRRINITKSGEQIWFIKRAKQYILPSTQSMGRREYWFYLRPDFEFEPITLENIDEKLKQLNVHIVHSDVRMARTNIHKYLESTLKKQGFFEKWGTTLGVAAFVVLVSIMLIVLFTQLKDLAGGLEAVARTLANLQQNTGGVPFPNTAANTSTSGLIPV